MAVPDLDIDIADLQRATEHVMVHGGSIAEVRGITPEELEAVSAIAYAEFGQQHYDKAEALFRFLCTLDHRVAKYWLGLGATRQELQQWHHQQTEDKQALHPTQLPQARAAPQQEG